MNKHAIFVTVVLVLALQSIAKPVQRLIRRASEAKPPSRHLFSKSVRQKLNREHRQRAHRASIIERHQHANVERQFPSLAGMSESICTSFLAKLDRPSEQICTGPFAVENSTQSAQRKIALVVRGESFRRNSAVLDRDIHVTDETQKCQLDASESHVRYLIEPLEACGIKVDVFLISWRPEGENAAAAMDLMKSKYNPRIVKSEWNNHSYTVQASLAEGFSAQSMDEQAHRYFDAFREFDSQRVDGQEDNYNSALRAVAESHNTYDGLFIIRADLEIKRSLVDLPDADWKKLLFAFHFWEKGGGYPSDTIQQFVPDTIFWFPWKVMNCAYTLGWKGEYFSYINDFIGLNKTGYLMPDEFHFDNSEADWNPLYAQACRQRQVYDVHGGHVIAMFNVMEIKDPQEAQLAGDAFRPSMFFQGDPRVLPPATMVMHSWTTQQAVKDVLRLSFGEIPRELAHESLDESDSESSWLAALHSIKRSFELLQNGTDFSFKRHYHPRFEFDRVAFVRLEHHLPSHYVSLYELDTSKAVFVTFGAEAYSFVPTLIVMSHEAAWKLGDYLVQNLPTWGSGSNVPPRTFGLYAWLEQVTGLPVKDI